MRAETEAERPRRGPGDAPLEGLPAPRLDGYAANDIAFAIAAWPMRAAEELRSALIFRALAQASARSPITEEWTPQFLSAARDELGHARLCAAVGARVGAAPPRWDLRPVRARLEPLTEPLFRASALALVEIAIGETISMAMFRAGRRAAQEPLTRAALQRILTDEVRHQRLGWHAIAAWWPELPAALRARLQHETPRALGAMEQQIAAPALRRLEARVPFEPSYSALGVLAPDARVAAFYAAVEQLVLPRLTSLGLDGESVWRDRYATT
jgi:P-aminobenzoate N-oxygenase AurF